MSQATRHIGMPARRMNGCATWSDYGASTMEIELPLDFKEFLKLLDEHEVAYLLIGGYAVAYYGYARATMDMDVWIAVKPDNAARVVAAVRDFGFDTPELTEALFLQQDSIVRMGIPPMRIEIHTGISGVGFDAGYRERDVKTLDDVTVNIISLRHLKTNKKASGRYKDLDDLENLP
jgi:hypothetical protein